MYCTFNVVYLLRDLKLHSDLCYLEDTKKCNCPCLAGVDSTKYLGMHIDCNLKWKHVSQTTNKVQCLIHVFCKFWTNFSERHLLMMYYALFCTIATYMV